MTSLPNQTGTRRGARKRLRRLGILLLVAGIPTGLFGGAASAAAIVREARSVSGFDRIVLRGVGDLAIRQGDRESLVVEAEPRILRNLSATVRSGILYLDVVGNVSTQQPIRYELTVKTLRDVLSEGSGAVELVAIRSPSLALTLGGSGEFKAASLRVDRLESNIAGSGSITTGGEAGEQSVRIGGAGDYIAEKLRTHAASIDISGSGSARVHVRDTLKVRISGSGNVTYSGNPRIEQDISGAGDVTRE